MAPKRQKQQRLGLTAASICMLLALGAPLVLSQPLLRFICSFPLRFHGPRFHVCLNSAMVSMLRLHCCDYVAQTTADDAHHRRAGFLDGYMLYTGTFLAVEACFCILPDLGNLFFVWKDLKLFEGFSGVRNIFKAYSRDLSVYSNCLYLSRSNEQP